MLIAVLAGVQFFAIGTILLKNFTKKEEEKKEEEKNQLHKDLDEIGQVK
jgi:sensor domain CHASE-containing protein